MSRRSQKEERDKERKVELENSIGEKLNRILKRNLNE